MEYAKLHNADYNWMSNIRDTNAIFLYNFYLWCFVTSNDDFKALLSQETGFDWSKYMKNCPKGLHVNVHFNVGMTYY